MPLRALTVCAVLLAPGLPALAAAPPEPLVELVGTDLKGGAAELFGSTRGAEMSINYVYAAPTGPRASMEASFPLAAAPGAPQYLYLKAVDDDAPTKCPIAIALNGRILFEGPSPWPDSGREVRRFAIPSGCLKVGANTLVVANRAKDGVVGMPPWFMVARCAVAPDGFLFHRSLSRDFWFSLPKEVRPFPEPLAAGRQPGFPIRGTKGWMWRPDQYLAEIPVLARYRMNFLMNCYGSMWDIENHPIGSLEVNRWWEDLPAAKKRAYEAVVRACDRNGIQFCFSMNPGLNTKRPLDYRSAEDLEQLWKHYAWMQGLGVRWFNVSLDDISQGIDASGQAHVVNALLARLRAKDPAAKMIFTPTIYWGDGTPPQEAAYLKTLARELDPDVVLFWTGNAVVGPITRQAAASYRAAAGHRLFLWDNYPVNDGNPTLHLGPVTGRDADLCAVVDGYMSNPMHRQNEANRIPLLTCADYAWNPEAYDPLRSVGQAIVHLEPSARGREVLRRLVQWYPGFILFGQPSTALNPVRVQFGRVLNLPHSRSAAEAYVGGFRQLVADMEKAFPRRYRAARETLRGDLAWLEGVLAERYRE